MPARTPIYIVDQLSSAIQQALKAQQVKDRATTEGAEIVRITQSQFVSFFADEVTRFGTIAKRAGISLQ